MTTLYVDNIAPNLQSKISAPNLTLPTGSVIQVKTGVYSTETNVSTSGAYYNTGLALSITPTSASSKILCLYVMQFRIQSSNSDIGIGFRLMRDGYAIETAGTSYDNYTYDGGQQTGFRGSDTEFYLDSPATTNAVAYNIQMVSYNGSGASCRVQSDGNKSRIMLMEIAG